jgi:hypothetical protein
MRLLLDSDAFCKFAAAGLLRPAALVLGADLDDARRLPVLPHMLRRGRLRRSLGDAVSDFLIPLAESIRAAPDASDAWLDRFVGVRDVDPGEAQILALAAQHGVTVLTGDKRALRALGAEPALVAALRLRIALPEVVLLRLCEAMGDDAVRAAVHSSRPTDTMLRVCFSQGNSAPRESLQSYIRDAESTIPPLLLWTPPPDPETPP